MAEIAASNVSNALTEGYARRDVQLSSRVAGGAGMGVTVDGVSRNVNQVLVQDLRLATSDDGFHGARAGFLTTLETAIGVADQAGSISNLASSFERSLVEAASRPDSDARLASVFDSATALVRGLAKVSSDIQDERQLADTRIGSQVSHVNDALKNVADLNIKIRAFKAAGRDASGLMDQRQQLVDRISSIVPVKEVARANDEIVLYTTGGTVLLDSRPAYLEFTPTGVITADMTVGSGALSGLTINGQNISTEPSGGRLGAGSLAAQFDIRDRLAPDAQSQLDAVARDLVERFAAPGLDPTVPVGAPGLFTDGGAAFNAADETGLAGRLRLNAAVDPDAGGGLWRLREGLGAGTPTAPGATGQLPAWSAALSDRRQPASGGFGSGARNFATLTADLTSGFSVKRLSAESETAYSTARTSALKAEVLRDGVDTDAEIEGLLRIEKAYAANSKVIQMVDEMLEQLLRI